MIRLFWMTLVAFIDPENGDELVSMFNRHHDRLFHYAVSILGSRADAEDVLQETWRKVYLHIHIFHGLSDREAGALLRKYTRNSAIDFLRKRNRFRRDVSLYQIEDDGSEAPLELLDDEPQPDELIIKRETRERVAACIAALPEPLRDVVEMKYRHQMRSSEIARVMGITENAVNLRLTRAKAELKEMLRGIMDE